VSTVKVRKAPRISCAKLSEYMQATPTRRRRILTDQKWPSDFITPLYTEAQEEIAGFIRRKSTDSTRIEEVIDRLSNGSAATEWHARKNGLCIDALKAFLNIAPDLDLSRYVIRQTHNKQPKLSMAGVEISVRPELLLKVKGKEGSTTSGAIKLCFSKNIPLNEESEKYFGALLHNFTYWFVEPVKTAAIRDCIIIDVFAEKVFLAPRATKRRMKELEDACREIATMWGSIPEPKERAKYRAGSHNPGAAGAKAT